VKRRDLSAALSALAPLLGASAATAAPAPDATGAAEKASAEQHHLDVMQRHRAMLGGRHLQIGMLVYPGMFLQDLVGPLTVFEALLDRDIHLLWKNRQPVGPEKPEHPGLIPVPPTTTFADCPAQLDVLFVPGGIPGTLTMMEDREVLDFLADRGAKARYVTSVCTGSLILGAAGLLEGYRATSYWATLDILREFGAVPSRQRIVSDRNRITGGGVTAGLDFGLALVAKLRSRLTAETIQLYLEYDPQPPFQAGSPARAPQRAKTFLDEMYAGLRHSTRTIAKRTPGAR
jgi:cyclohexyl-isocyanide hydratase